MQIIFFNKFYISMESIDKKDLALEDEKFGFNKHKTLKIS